jgi:hypothetical protein
MSEQQESGHLVTGFKRWEMRQSSRTTLELSDGVKWACPQGCGKEYRMTSASSIQKHKIACKLQPLLEPIRGSGYCSDDSVGSSPAVTADGERKQREAPRTRQAESKYELGNRFQGGARSV